MLNSDVFAIKDKIQRTALNHWYLNKCIGTLEMCTGTGKSRCGVLASEWIASLHNYDCKILIVTPTEEIRDNAWKEEFHKWEADLVFEQCVQVLCIQSACKLIGHHWDLLIVDEYHNTIKDYNNPEDSIYMKLYSMNTYSKLLALTAYLPPNKKYWGNFIAKTVFSLNTNQAVELGLVTPFIIYNVPISLNENELKVLSYIEGKIEYLQEKGYKGWKWVSKRRLFFSKIQKRFIVAKQISDYFYDKRGILFSEYIEDVKNLQAVFNTDVSIIHSKMKKKERKESLLKYNKKETNRIIAAKALNEGVNLVDTYFAIAVTANSSIKDLTQELGRLLRIDNQDFKKAIYIRLYVPNSRDEFWLKQSQLLHSAIYCNSVEDLFNKLDNGFRKNI